MTDKRKQRVRQRMKSTGMSYQAVSNTKARKPKPCPSCKGPWFDFSQGGIVLHGYQHTAACQIGQMVRVPNEDATRCPKCGHVEPIVRTKPHGISVHFDCPECFKRIGQPSNEAAYEYLMHAVTCNVYGPARNAAAQILNDVLPKRLARYDGWIPEGARLRLSLTYFEDPESYDLPVWDEEEIVREGRYDRLLLLVDRHAREKPLSPPKAVNVTLSVLVPRAEIEKLKAAGPEPIRRE